MKNSLGFLKNHSISVNGSIRSRRRWIRPSFTLRYDLLPWPMNHTTRLSGGWEEEVRREREQGRGGTKWTKGKEGGKNRWIVIRTADERSGSVHRQKGKEEEEKKLNRRVGKKIRYTVKKVI